MTIEQPWSDLSAEDCEVVDGHAAQQPLQVAEAFAAIGRGISSSADSRGALEAVTEMALEIVPQARWVSVTRGVGDRFVTMASSDPVALAADRLQYQLGRGPCVEAAVDDTVFVSNDLARDDRWGAFGPRAARECGARSVLSTHLFIDDDGPDQNAALNIYSDRTNAFDESARTLAILFATHAAVSVAAVVNREHAQQLREALKSNREIGVAVGVLMTAHKVTRDQAFDLLRIASQNSNRKLRDVATDVADTGALDLPSPTRHSRS